MKEKIKELSTSVIAIFLVVSVVTMSGITCVAAANGSELTDSIQYSYTA